MTWTAGFSLFIQQTASDNILVVIQESAEYRARISQTDGW